MKLRSILMHWRLGRKDNPPEETGHPEVSAGRFWTLGRNTAVGHFVVSAAGYDPGARTSEAPDRPTDPWAEATQHTKQTHKEEGGRNTEALGQNTA